MPDQKARQLIYRVPQLRGLLSNLAEFGVISRLRGTRCPFPNSRILDSTSEVEADDLSSSIDAMAIVELGKHEVRCRALDDLSNTIRSVAIVELDEHNAKITYLIFSVYRR